MVVLSQVLCLWFNASPHFDALGNKIRIWDFTALTTMQVCNYASMLPKKEIQSSRKF